LRSNREENPPKTIQRRLDFEGGQQVQREKMTLEIVQAQTGESYLTELSNRFQGLRRSNKRCKSRRFLRGVYLPWRIQLI
jgi:hypothetical protein